MNWIIAKLIYLLHIIFILFVILVPFTNSTYLLFVHSILIPFLMIHWMTFNNTCILTIIEKHLRTKNGVVPSYDDCFTCKLIEPIYDVSKNYNGYSTFLYVFSTILWTISISKLICKKRDGHIKTLSDLFII